MDDRGKMMAIKQLAAIGSGRTVAEFQRVIEQARAWVAEFGQAEEPATRRSVRRGAERPTSRIEGEGR